MVTKRELGIGYFIGTGVGLILSLVGYFVLVDSTADLLSLGTVSALGFAGSLPYLGYWLWKSELTDSAIWAIARWCGIGLAIPTVFAATLILMGLHLEVILEFPHLLANFIAAGGTAGALLGLVNELRRQQTRAEELNRRNTILNLIMRHDIRNDVNVIKGYSDLLAERLDGEAVSLLKPIEKKSAQIIETSRLAEQIQSIEEDPDRKAIDVVASVSSYVDEARDSYPAATIETALPEAAWADAGELSQTVVANLVENAIEHNDGDPRVRIEVVDGRDDQVVVRVEDNGPGVPEPIRRALLEEGDDSAADSPGLGLWLVKWVVAGYGGELSLTSGETGGTVAEVRLPTAEPPDAEQPVAATASSRPRTDFTTPAPSNSR